MSLNFRQVILYQIGTLNFFVTNIEIHLVNFEDTDISLGKKLAVNSEFFLNKHFLEDDMGLNERRLVATAQENEFKPFVEKVKEIVKYDLAIDFDWSAIENHSQISNIVENQQITGYCFNRITEALANVCADDMGRSAIKERLKGIKIIPTPGEILFSDGILTINTCVVGDGTWGASQIQENIEKHL